MKGNCLFFKAMFIALLFMMAGFQSAKAEEILDVPSYQGFLTEDGAINDGWWAIYDVYGRNIHGNAGERTTDLWSEAQELQLILEIDSQRNLVSSIWGNVDETDSVNLWAASLIEIQDNHTIFHGYYYFKSEEHWLYDPAPRYPRFYQPGEGYSLELHLQKPQSPYIIKENSKLTFLGKGQTAPSLTIPGEDSLENLALVAYNENVEYYQDDVLMEYYDRSMQDILAPGKGIVSMFEHYHFWNQWEEVEKTGVNTFVQDSVIDWGRGDYPEIFQGLDIEEVRATLADLPLATNIKDVTKTGVEKDPENLSDLHKADILFNWLESQVPDLLSPTPQTTQLDDELIWRSYQGTDNAVGTMQDNLLYLDENGDLHDLGTVDEWLDLAMP